MRRSTLDRLRVPSPIASQYMELELDETLIEPIWSEDGADLIEGLLRDRSGGTIFPVLGGVAVLLPDPLAWLRARFPQVLAALRPCGGISDGMFGWLESIGITNGNCLVDDYYETSRWVNIFTSTHYDARPGGTDDESRLGRFLAAESHVFDVVADRVRTHTAGGGSLLDVGCNVGGMAHRLADGFDEVYGVDVCFHPVLTARRIQVGQPRSQSAYQRYLDGERREFREIESPRTRADFMTGTLERLPLKGGFDAVVALNVVDVVPDPRAFLAAIREAASPGGFVVITSPYSWGSDSTPMDRWIGGRKEASSHAMLEAVKDVGLELIEEVDDIPWVLREHRRWYRVFLNHCIFARRT